jgi:DNA topoisomerase-1
MSKTLVIVESPGKVKKISKFLGDDYIVKASFGHIVDLSTTGKGRLGVDIENNFEPKYEVIPDKKDKIRAIVTAASKVSRIYIASDNDREGEAIAFHLAEILKKTKLPIQRVTFNAITKAAVTKAVKDPGELNKDLYDAQQARRVLDRIVGFSVSPFLIKRLGPNLSAGRVQSVAVRLVVDREREIEAFEPEEYWNISTTHTKENDKEKFLAKYAKKVTDGKTAKKIKSDLDTDTYKVGNVVEEERKKNPYPPLITSSLASAAAGKYRFAAARTMKAAQSLYEKGAITYIRTDSVRSAPEAIANVRTWLEENGYDKPDKANNYSTKKNAQDAHEAIRPTDVSLTAQNLYVTDDEQKIYKLIWERFVASQMKPALYDSVAATVESSSGHLLKANGRTLKYKGWLEIAGDLDKKDDDARLPKLIKGEALELVAPKVMAEQKFTKPPSRYSEQTLIKELEKRGIGRPSTYASIMGKITNKSYVVRKSNAFVPTDRGKQVVDKLKEFFDFLQYDYTASMESKLDQIADGKLGYAKMLAEFYKPFQSQLKKAYGSDQKDYGFKCNKCNSQMVLKHGSFGFFLACIDYPTCKNTVSCDMVDEKPVIKASKFGEPVKGVKCPNCKSGMSKRDGKFGPFYSCLEYPTCKGTRKVPYGKKCPKCSNELYATVYKGQSVLFCMGYPNCNHSEDLPDGEVANPKDLVGSKIPKKINKMLK